MSSHDTESVGEGARHESTATTKESSTAKPNTDSTPAPAEAGTASDAVGSVAATTTSTSTATTITNTTSGADGGEQPRPVCLFTNPKRPRNVRQRQSAVSSSTAASAAEGGAKALEVGATATAPAAANEAEEPTEVVAHVTKRRRAVLSSSSRKSLSTAEEDDAVSFSYSSEKSCVPVGRQDMGATSVLDIDPEEKAKSATTIEAAENAEGAYKGLGGYTDYIEHKHQSGIAKGSGIRAGPVRAPLNIRVSCRFDYQPDICKDYKDTGYCGYGDNCKFVHDRGDYKSGWQLEKEWEDQQKAKAEARGSRKALPHEKYAREHNRFHYPEPDDSDPEDDEDKEEEFPFACLICKAHWDTSHNPVVTRCLHYFCEACALEHNRKSTKCFVCNKQTGGVFNIPHALLRRIKMRDDRLLAATRD
ncbi:RING finger protein 113A-like [Pelomyxa schiedti]|nr:RING finger protein 113A-like [Pelomyxa schiedti]